MTAQEQQIQALTAENERLRAQNAQLQTLVQTRAITRLAEISDAFSFAFAGAEQNPSLDALLRKLAKHLKDLEAFASGIVVPDIIVTRNGGT